MNKLKVVGRLFNNIMIGLAFSGLITFLMIYLGASGVLFDKGETGVLQNSYQTFFNYTWPWYLYGAWCGVAATLIDYKVFKFYAHFPLIFLPWLAIMVYQGQHTFKYAIPLFIIIYVVLTLVFIQIERKTKETNDALRKFQEQMKK